MQIVVISGGGGNGKSSVAQAFVREQLVGKGYKEMVWLKSDGMSSLVESCRALLHQASVRHVSRVDPADS